MTEYPIASVLILAYNHESYIENTIKSVVSQKCSFNFEIVVTDDASTDRSLAIILELQSQYPTLIRVISNEKNLGLNFSFRNAVRSAKGDFVALLGGDDYWIVDNKLEMQVQLLLSQEDVAYVHTEFKKINESDGSISGHHNKGWLNTLPGKTGRKALAAMLSLQWPGYPLASSACFRKDPLLKGMKNHPEILSYDLPGEGTITHASMLYYGGQYAFIPVETTMYRVRESSLSHYTSNADQFDYQTRYYLLRIFTAESFGLGNRAVKSIKYRGLIQLFKTALELGTTTEFQTFQQTQRIGIWLQIILYLCKSRILRYIYKTFIRQVSRRDRV